MTRLRIAQWGSGNVGARALAAVLEHPAMELVALKVFNPAKVGMDAGEICGKPATGVHATIEPAEVIAAKPDCVIYLPGQADIGEMVALLKAGINIVTACIGFNHRASIPEADRLRLEAACASGGSSLYATGSSPGWITELVPLALLNMQRRLDRYIITDYADMATRDSRDMLVNQLGFGTDPAGLSTERKLGTAVSTPPTFRALAEAIGMPLDEVTTSTEYAVARSPAEIAIGTIEAGTVGAMRMAVHGWHEGREVLTRYSLWYVTRDLDPAWECRDSGWRIQVQGDTSLDISIGFDVAPEDYAAYSPGLTAHPLVNAIETVCAAPPGILHTSELPMLVPRF